ncbi:hypothetical protein [uncultured Proteiniphilum sp.]|uniref:hypothetical protein n=1 Tax=uncultured Proteiniphilum sp. TaxID=497637 RepID=UPI002637C560|nr:hypothetical protein [uncultured Proteiniphilum sp.]
MITPPDINAPTIIDTELYNGISGVNVLDAEIIGDVLKVSIGASGCDGSTWEARLISAGGIIKTNPPQREVKIEFINKEVCAAALTKTFVFDLKPLRVKEIRKVSIHLEGWPHLLLYTY